MMFKLLGRLLDGGASSREDAAVEGEGGTFPPSHVSRAFENPIAEVEYVGDTAVATLTVTDLTADMSAEQLANLIHRLTETRTAGIVLDIQNVQHIDSTCLSCMVDACNRLAADGGKIALANAHQNVQHVFKLTRLDRVFPICPDVMAAINTVERQSRSSEFEMLEL